MTSEYTQEHIEAHRHQLAEALLTACRENIKQAVAEELEHMAAAFEKSSAADWDDADAPLLRPQHDAFDDGLLAAAGRLRARAAVIRAQKDGDA